jgi:drug/metabolite transporter (DMT)-like permease
MAIANSTLRCDTHRHPPRQSKSAPESRLTQFIRLGLLPATAVSLMLNSLQSSVINGLMLPQIALLAWLVLGEPLSVRQIIGLVLAGASMIVVQQAAAPGMAQRRT